MSRWTVRRHPRPNAPMSLYCFPHAGGAPGEYVRWSDALPDIQVWGVHLPGRTSRIVDPPFTRMEPLVDALVSAVDFEGPFMFFGHSLGALVAYETARELRRRGRAQPARLVLSSCPPPSPVPAPRPVRARTDEELLDAIEEFQGGPLDQVRDDPGLRAHQLGCCRADFALLESYSPAPDDDPLDCPVTVLAGTGEPWAARAGDWAAHTRGPVHVRLLPGGHFYFRVSGQELFRSLRAAVSPSTGGSAWTA